MARDFFIDFRGERDVCIEYSGSTQQDRETGAYDLEWWFQDEEKAKLELTDAEELAITDKAFEHARDSESDADYE